MAELVLTSTTTSIEVEVVGLSDEYKYFSFSIYTYPGPPSGSWINDSGGYINRNYIKFTGLNPDTHYSIFCDYSIDGIPPREGNLSGDINTLNPDEPDPDEPDPDEPAIYEWYCYDITNEEWLSNEGEDNLPITRPNLSSFSYEYIGYVYEASKKKCIDWYYYNEDVDSSKATVSSISGDYSCIVFFYEKTTTVQTVQPWNWKSSNGEATAEQTQKAEEAIKNYGRLSNFSYLVWNDMCAKIKEIRIAAGVGEWDTGVYDLSYNDTRMSDDDKVLTADRFNSLRYNIGSQYGTGIDEVSSGQPVIGEDFITLMDKANEWIKEIIKKNN